MTDLALLVIGCCNVVRYKLSRYSSGEIYDVGILSAAAMLHNPLNIPGLT